VVVLERGPRGFGGDRRGRPESRSRRKRRERRGQQLEPAADLGARLVVAGAALRGLARMLPPSMVWDPLDRVAAPVEVIPAAGGSGESADGGDGAPEQLEQPEAELEQPDVVTFRHDASEAWDAPQRVEQPEPEALEVEPELLDPEALVLEPEGAEPEPEPDTPRRRLIPRHLLGASRTPEPDEDEDEGEARWSASVVRWQGPGGPEVLIGVDWAGEGEPDAAAADRLRRHAQWLGGRVGELAQEAAISGWSLWRWAPKRVGEPRDEGEGEEAEALVERLEAEGSARLQWRPAEPWEPGRASWRCMAAGVSVWSCPGGQSLLFEARARDALHAFHLLPPGIEPQPTVGVLDVLNG
jgi:hypothetical protein